MNTRPNTYERSQRAENHAASLNRRPAQYLVELLNLYHSLDKIYFSTKEEATAARTQIRTEIEEASTSIPRALRFKVEYAMKNPKAWEELRNHIF